MARTITSANAVITLTIPGLYNSPIQLKGFSADNIYTTDNQDITETSMGVDGVLSGGFVFTPVTQTISLQSDSTSNDLFSRWIAAQKASREVITANGRTTLSAIGRAFVSTKGFLVSIPPMPTAARTLQPRAYTIQWQSVQEVPR